MSTFTCQKNGEDVKVRVTGQSDSISLAYDMNIAGNGKITIHYSVNHIPVKSAVVGLNLSFAPFS